MKFSKLIKKDVDVKYVLVSFPLRYVDHDGVQLNDPMVKNGTWTAEIEIETGKITDWPIGRTLSFDEKIADTGSYTLLDENGNTVVELIEEYVPNKLINGSYGDYIELDIDENGIIKNWNPRNLSEFEQYPV